MVAASPLSSVFGFPLLAVTNQLPALDPSRRGGEGDRVERGQRRDSGKKLLEGSCRYVLTGAGGRYRRTSEGSLPALAVALWGAGRMAAGLLLHLLLINNLCGARTQLLCVIKSPVEFVSPQPPKTVGAPRDLAAASSLCPKIKEL